MAGARKRIEIDVSEEFEHLPNAPIVEAVIHWRAFPEQPFEPEALRVKLQDDLPDYPRVQPQQKIELHVESSPSGDSRQEHTRTWHGFRVETADGKQIAQFTRDGLVFSRLRPYEDWTSFEVEACRVWEIFCRHARPAEVQRLGVRFINAVSPVHRNELSQILAIPPKSPSGFALPVKEFMHQSRFEVPAYDYILNTIVALQPQPAADGSQLIIDVDVFTETSLETSGPELSRRLQEMRWIKDKAFFTLLKDKALQRFRE